MSSDIVKAVLSKRAGDNAADEEIARSADARQAKMKEFLAALSQRKTPSKNVHFHLVEVDIVDAKTKEKMCTLERVANVSSISTVKDMFEKKFPQYYTSRQSFSLKPGTETLPDNATLADLNLSNECAIYFTDLGPQMTWYSVFYFQYAASLILYLFFYIRPPYVYDCDHVFTPSADTIVHIAALCHTLHYVRRLMETRFVHKFSGGTMPVASLFKNTCLYWGFSAWMGYFVNHPLYTPPMYGDTQVHFALAQFVFCEVGNFSIHYALANFKQADGSEVRAPHPTRNPFTWLFALVSCPDYLYETGSWVAFAVMTQTVVAILFTMIGLGQMAVWALNNHQIYTEEFPNYPRTRKAILPFLL